MRVSIRIAGVVGVLAFAAASFAQAPAQQQPAGGRGTPAAGAQTPAQDGRGGQDGRGAQDGRGGGRGGRGGRGGAGAGGAQPTSFFITSVGKGDGGNLGGLAGADAHCAQLAKAAGLPDGRTWRAYLSAAAANGQPSVNARDRIGAGPWYNAKGVLIASNVADLHGDIERDRNQITKANALTEKGTTINGIGDDPNQHDMLTGSDTHGRAMAGTTDTTCSNWTSHEAGSAPAATEAAGGRGAAAGATSVSGPGANVGHHDRQGGTNTSWNFAHRTRGCSQQDLVATGGAGLFYCFGAN